MRRLVVWGAGELGSRVAQLWAECGGEVLGFTRTPRRHVRLQENLVKTFLGSPLPHLTTQDILLISLPGHELQKKAVIELQRDLEDQQKPYRSIYISSTGFYGSQIAGSLNESTKASTEPRAQKIAQAEDAFCNWADKTGVILRLGGLWSQTRGPVQALIKRGAASLGPPNKYLALIHYDDAAGCVKAAGEHSQPQSHYLTVTNPCPTRQEFYEFACSHLKLRAPEFADSLKGHPVAYDTGLMKRDLLQSFKYPDWRQAVSPLVL